MPALRALPVIHLQWGQFTFREVLLTIMAIEDRLVITFRLRRRSGLDSVIFGHNPQRERKQDKSSESPNEVESILSALFVAESDFILGRAVIIELAEPRPHIGALLFSGE